MAKGSGLDQQLVLSEDLADFMGKSKASRAQITKALWVHIKKHDLQDPKNRQNILCDDVLSPILGKKLTMFQMGGKVSKHVSKE